MISNFTFSNFQKIKLSLSILFFSMSLLSFSQNPCTPMLDCTDNDVIFNVTLETLNNPSTCGANGYSDFTALPAPTLNEGQTYPISVTVGDGWTNESVSVWIDYNNDTVFNEDEFTYIGTGTDEVLTGNITLPVSLASTNVIMRVRVAAVGETSATWQMSCDESDFYGETEDYTVALVGTLSVDNFNKKPQISIFKTTNALVIESGNHPLLQINLYDISGKLVLTKENINNTTMRLNVASLSQHVYIMKIETMDGTILTKKIAN